MLFQASSAAAYSVGGGAGALLGWGAAKGADPLVAQLRGAIQEQVDRLLAEGPPAQWNCPKQPVSLTELVSSLPNPDPA